MGLELPRIGRTPVRLPPISPPSQDIDRARFALAVAQTQATQLIAAKQPVEVRAPARAAPRPPNARSLTVCSLAAGQGLLAAQQADVVCLHGAARASVAKLGDALGLHSAFIENGAHGKAILSRYPFVAGSVKNENFRDGVKDRFDAALRAGQLEPAIQRSVLMVSIDVGGRPIDVLGTQLSRLNPRANAAQLAELHTLMRAREAKGLTVVLAGDFHTNLALASAPVSRQGDAFDAGPTAARLLGERRTHWKGPSDAVVVSRDVRLTASSEATTLSW